MCWCYVVIWLGWCGICMQAEAVLFLSITISKCQFMLTTMSMCCLTAFLLNSFFIVRATQVSISFNRPPPSGSAMLYSALNCFSYNLVCTGVGTSYGAGYAPIPWKDFEYIWHDISHDHPKITTKNSTFYLYILISCGC